MQPFRHLTPLALFLAATATAQTPLPSPQPDIQLFCPPGVDDAGVAGVNCIGASSTPQNGYLYPLGQDFFIDPFGRVGFGTTSPGARLEVLGAGGNDSRLRIVSTGPSPSSVALQRTGGTPAYWEMTCSSLVGERDLVINDNLDGATRLRIEAGGTVVIGDLHVADDTSGLRFLPSGSSVSIVYETPNTVFPATLMTAHFDQIDMNRDVHVEQEMVFGPSSSLRFTEHDFLGLPSPPMIYMFEDGASNEDKMVLAHSEAFENWGLRYDDDIDSFHFLANGTGVMTVDLPGGMVGIGDPTPSTILQIRQNSATDPIADAWTTYSSRRWKENIEPIEDALGLVRALRGVTFDWKESGQHDLGMIAEEVGEVVPEVVAFEENGVDAQSIDYARLTAVLVEAVKEQDARLDAQEQRIEELARRLEALEQP